MPAYYQPAISPPATAEALVADIDRLVSYPDVWLRINRQIDAGAGTASLAQVVEMDTDLSARVLRTVNSAFYRLASPVETISRAVTIIGTADLRDLSLLTVARRLFTGIPAEIMDLHKFWNDAVSTGVYAALLGRHCNMLHPERAYVMGVIHNIGLLVLCRYLPEQARDALLIATDDETVLPDAEREIIGYTHAQVGAALLRRWKLPGALCEAAAFHHEPELAENYPLDVAVVHVAMLLTNGLGLGQEFESIVESIHASAAALVDVDAPALENVADQGMVQIIEMLRGYQPDDAYR